MTYNPKIHHRRSIRLKGYDYTQAGAYFITLVTWQRDCLFGEIVNGEMRVNSLGKIVQAEWQQLARSFPNIRLDAFVVMPNHVHGIIIIDPSVRATRPLPDGMTDKCDPLPDQKQDHVDGSPRRALSGPLPDGMTDKCDPLPDQKQDHVDGSPRRALSGPLPDGMTDKCDPLPDQKQDHVDGSPRQVPVRPNGPPAGSLGAMIGQFKSRATKRIWRLPGMRRRPIWQRDYYEHIIRNEAEYQRIWNYIHNNPLQWEKDQLTSPQEVVQTQDLGYKSDQSPLSGGLAVAKRGIHQEERMKIVKIEQFFPRPRTRLVKITTDNGLVGWGETTLEGKPKSTMAAVDELAEYLLGKDPLRIEHHWQHIYRSAFFRGGPVNLSALSGIDQALWDIAGKFYGAPVYQLLGGAVRDRIRVYAHWGIHDLSEAGQAAAHERLERLQKMGYTAYKSGPGGKWRGHEPPAVIDEFVKRAYLMREWVGPQVELAFDFHGKFTPALAIEICHELRGMRPMFVEEPVPQENVDALKLVSDHVSFPIATGERLLTRWGFREVFEKHAVAYIQPDTSHVGGISELKKVANMAEVYYMHVLPHCAIGPVAFAAGMQVDAVTPNFLIQEQVDACLGDGLLQTDWQVVDGHIALPTQPGLGFEINEQEAQQNIPYVEELGGEFYHPADGSVVDW